IGWAVQAVVLAYLATRASKETALYGSNAERLLIAAGADPRPSLRDVLVFVGPPRGVFPGGGGLGGCRPRLGACAAAARFGRFALRDFDPRVAQVCEVLAATAFVYLASVTIIDTVGVTDSGDPRQTGQVLLSAFWTLTGLSAVVYGLLRDVRRFRLGGLALL